MRSENMNSEGEFQKRIKEKTSDWYGYESRWRGEDLYICPEDIVAMIDEAKREFPVELLKYKKQTAFYYLEHKNAIKKISEVIQWFEKWFGEPAK